MSAGDNDVDKMLAELDAELERDYPGQLKPKRTLALKPKPDRQKQLLLGHAGDSSPVLLPEPVALEHLHVIGATGGGKTNALEHLARQVITLGRGILLIDPNGSHPDGLFRRLVAYVEEKRVADQRPVHILDPNETSQTFGFNPLAIPPGTDASVVADTALEAIARIWGEDLHDKPTIRSLLSCAFIACAESGLTLADVPHLFESEAGSNMRLAVISKVSNDTVRAELERLEALASDRKRAQDFDITVRGPINRFNELMKTPALALALGQTTRTLDLAAAMDENAVILANLQPGRQLSEASARVLGALLLRYAFAATFRRTNVRTPFYVMADEAPEILTGDVGKLLPLARKFGVSVTLAHQFLQQLQAAGDDIYHAVRATARVKMVFGLAAQDEAESLARDIVPLDLEEAKTSMIRPTVVGQKTVILRNVTAGTTISDGEGRAVTEAEQQSVGTSVGETAALFSASALGEGLSLAQGLTPEVGWLETPAILSLMQGQSSIASRSSGESTAQSRSLTEAFARSLAVARSAFKSKGMSETTGASEAYENIFKDLPTQLYSKDEQLYRAGKMLRQLAPGQGFVAFRNKASAIQTPLMPKLTFDDTQFRPLLHKVLSHSPSAKSASDGQKEISSRRAAFAPIAPIAPQQSRDAPIMSTEPAPPPQPIDAPEPFLFDPEQPQRIIDKLLGKDAPPSKPKGKPKLTLINPDNDDTPPKTKK